DSGAAATRQSGGGQATVGTGTQSTSRTTVRERSGVAVGGSRRTVGVRSDVSDDSVIVKRKKRYIASGPTVIKKNKRYTTYREPSSTVVINKRRSGVAVDSGVSTRSTVRSGSSTTVGTSSSTRGSAGGGANIRQGSSGQGGTSGQGAAGASSGQGNIG